MKMKATDIKNMPEEEMAMMMQGLLGLGYIGEGVNGSASQPDYSSPILKPVVARIYPLFIILYALPAALGIATNVLVMMYISKYKLNRDATQAFLVNLAVCHTVQCTFVLPITLMVMLLQNWIFGQFLCFFLPLLQDIPLHVAMISHLLIAWDRKRWLTDPLKARLPAFVCSCASWLAGMVIALPYPIYTTYLDLGKYLERFEGVGICAVNLVDDMQEYMRGLFVIMYCGPMALLGYLYIRTSRELRPPDGPLSIMMFEARAEARSKQIRASRSGTGGSVSGGGTGSASIGANLSASSRTYDLYDAEVDVNREKRTQRHLGAMASAQVLCVCPLMILRLARMTLVETYENQAHFDITYLMFVWIAFLPTVIVPWIYASWMLSRPAKERLRGYLRLSSRRNTKSEQSVDDGGTGNSSPPGVKTPLSIQTTSSTGNQHKSPSAVPPAPQESSLIQQKPSMKKQLPSIDRSKSPAGGSTRTQQSTVESTIAESSISNATTATAKSVQSTLGRPRRQLPPPLRIDNSNFHKTPSVKSRGSGGSAAAPAVQRSSMRSTTGRVGRAGENPVDEEDDYAGSNITSSTYCNINEREVVAPPELYEALPIPRQNVLHKSASPYYQSEPNGREAHDLDSDSDIYQRQRPARYGSLSKQDSGILHKPGGTPSIISISESEYSSRKGSLSTLSRDLEIIDRLERERSMDIQEMLQREKNYEYYLARQNSKLKFSTNFDDYFDEEPQQAQQKLPLVKQSSNSSHVPSQRSVSPHNVRNMSNRRSSNLSYASTKRDSGYEQSLLETPPVAPPVLTPGSHSNSVAAASYRSNGPRRSLELEKQRIARTYSGHSTRSSTRSRDRVSFHDDV